MAEVEYGAEGWFVMDDGVDLAGPFDTVEDAQIWMESNAIADEDEKVEEETDKFAVEGVGNADEWN